MLTPKSISGFAARLLVLYVLLAAVPGDAVRDAYGRIYRAAGNGIFGSFGSRGVVRFQQLTESSDQADTKMVFQIRPSQRKRSMTGRSWETGWRPTATFLALMLATPIPWSRRWRALSWGILWVHVFVVFRLLVVVAMGFCQQPGGLYPLGRFWMEVSTALRGLSIGSPSTFLAPILIWILVSFRRGDRAAIFGATQQATE